MKGIGMRSGLFLLLILLLSALGGCDQENAPDCFQSAGTTVQKEFDLPAFEEIIVYDRINLFLAQGPQKVVLETGENLLPEISVRVDQGRLVLENSNDCNFVRDYNTTNVYVTVPNLTWLQNAGNTVIQGLEPLYFQDIWLRSLNQEQKKGVYTNGDFRLHLISENIRVTGDDFSNFYLSGTTEYLDLYIAAGDGRVEAADLEAQTVEIQHRGTNKLIVHPRKILKGEIRSTGDVIAVNRPEIVQIKTFYTGKLIFRP